MAKFKVGDRVRKIANHPTRKIKLVPVGTEGTVAAMPDEDGDYAIRYDGWGLHFAEEWQLAPLTPPAEDTWAADAVRKVTRVHVEPLFTKREQTEKLNGESCRRGC